MDIPEEMRMMFIFCREAALTKYYHTPNYARFKHLVQNVYHFVGLDKVMENIKVEFLKNVVKMALK